MYKYMKNIYFYAILYISYRFPIYVVWGLALLTAVMGLVFSFLGPAQQAWVGEMVPKRQLPNAVALSQLAMNVARVAGPLVAGAMITTAAIGSGGAYLFMAGLFVVVLFTVWRLPNTRAKPQSERRPVFTELIQGFRYVGGHATIRTLMLLFTSVVVLGFMWQIVLPSFLERQLGRDPTDIGLIFSINAVSALAGALALTGIVGTKWAWPALFGTATLTAVGFFVLASAPNFEVALLATLALGPGLSGFMLVNNSLVMANIDPGYFGRVMSLNMLAWGLQGTLSLPFGMLADKYGEREMLVVGGILLLCVTAIAGLKVAGLARKGQLASPGEVQPPDAVLLEPLESDAAS